jgi:predicted aminopeptidase
MRQRKGEIFAALAKDLAALDARDGFKSRLVAELESSPPNNARLASLATYYDCVPGFERLLESVHRDLPRFYSAVRDLAKLDRDERSARLCVSEAAR